MNNFRRLITTFDAPDEIESASEFYGDWPEIDTPCDESPVGQCEYSVRDPDRCIHCGKKA